MGSLNGVDITKGSVGASAIAPASSISALIFNGVAIAGYLEFNTVYTVKSLKEAETLLGITGAYDSINRLVVHRHILDFYTPTENENVKLYLMCLPMATTPADALEDTAATAARKLLTTAKGEVKQLGYALNLAVGTVEGRTDGLNSLIRAAIPKAQALYDWAYSTDRPCNILLEGRGIADTVTTLLDLRNITVGASVLDANKVSIAIGQDWEYAETRNSGQSILCAKYAGVGKALGTVAAADVNQSIAEVDEVNGGFNLSNATKGYWNVGGLSNHKTIDELDDFLVGLDEKGYIFPITHHGVSGLRWNGDHTCTPIVVDEDGNINEHTIYYGRTMDNAAMRLKVYLVKLVKKRVGVDVTTGKLPKAVLKQLNASANINVFDRMVGEGLISGGKSVFDATSNVLPPNSLLKASFDIVPTAILDKVEGKVYLKKSIAL